MTTQEATQEDKKTTLESGLPYFIGSESYYRTTLNPRFVITDGVKFLVDTAGAHWLVDVLASHLTHKKVRREAFQVWTLTRYKTGGGCVVRATDGGKDGNGPKRIATQRIEYTDFPLDEVTLYVEWNGSHWVCLLPSEH